MSDKTYDPADTSLLVVDPYNDFMSEGGKLYDQIKDVADSVDIVRQPAKADPGGSIRRAQDLRAAPPQLPRGRLRKLAAEDRAPGDGYGEQGFRSRGTWGGIPPGIRPPEGVTSLFTSTGHRAASPTRTSTFNSSSTASVRSSWSPWSPTRASSLLDVSGWNSAITSHWSRMPPPPSAGRRCKPLSRSTGRPSHAFHLDDGPVARRDRLTLVKAGSSLGSVECDNKEKYMRSDMNLEQKNGVTAATQDVLTHHLDCFGKGDLASTMTDYTDESRFFTPDGMLRGSEAIRPFFASLRCARRSDRPWCVGPRQATRRPIPMNGSCRREWSTLAPGPGARSNTRSWGTVQHPTV